jgi:hypothetical protein
VKLSSLPLTPPQRSFADGDTKTGGEIDLGSILNDPTGLLEEEINLLPSLFFGSHGWARTAGSVTEKSHCVGRSRSFGERERIGILDQE